jgi:GNAT superfamily N-acetyltransferase
MSSAEVQVRRATLADWDVLSRLMAKMLVGHTKFEPLSSPEAVAAGVMQGLKTDEAVFLAETSSGPVGYIAWVCFPLSPPGLVSGLGTYVEPEFRGKGVSAQLRDAAEEFCKSKGATVVQGVVHVDNESGLESSLRRGFKVTGHLLSKSL